jgi:hypothetical protein
MTVIAPSSTLVEPSERVRAFLGNSPQRLLIGGDWVPANGGGVTDVMNPPRASCSPGWPGRRQRRRRVSAASSAFENPPGAGCRP